MLGYRLLWWVLTCLLSAFGLLAALSAVPGLLLLLLALSVLTLGGRIRAFRKGQRPAADGACRSPASPAQALSTTLGVGAAAAGAGTALLGLTILLGWTVAGPVGLLLGVVSPSAVRRYSNRRRSGKAASDTRQVIRPTDPAAPASVGERHGLPYPVPQLGPGPQPDAGVQAAPGLVSQLTVGQLCGLWRSSYSLLPYTVDSGTYQKLVEHRQRYHDELERRDPAAFGRWLALGAGAVSDPSPYFATPGPADR